MKRQAGFPRGRQGQAVHKWGRTAGWTAPRGRTTFARAQARRGGARAFLQKNSGELKGMDTDLAIVGPIIATTSTNTDAFAMNLVEPGNGSYNRIGRKIFCKTLRISGVMQYQYNADPTSGSATGVACRMVVVWDKQPSGTLPTFDVMFGRTSQAGLEATTVFDNLRYDNMSRFQVLRNLMLEANPYVGDGGGTTNLIVNSYNIDEFIDLKNRTTVFSGDSDPVTIADISSGGLYVFFRAEASAANVTDWVCNPSMHSRLRFTS